MEKKKGKFSPIFVQFFVEKETKPITEGISKNKDATFRTLSRRCVLVIVVSCRIVLVILRKIYFFILAMYKSDTLDGTIARLTHYSAADNKWHVSERNGHYILLIGHYIGTLGFHECD